MEIDDILWSRFCFTGRIEDYLIYSEFARENPDERDVENALSDKGSSNTGADNLGKR